MLNRYRKQINEINFKIIELLYKRNKISKKIGDYKKRKNLKVYDKKREAEILTKVSNTSKEKGLDEKYIKKVFKIIIKNSRESQK